MNGARRPDLTRGALSDAEALERALEGIVARVRTGARMAHVDRHPVARASSWWIEELVVTLDDGRTLKVIFKNLGREVPGSLALRAKPSRILDPGREPWVYRTILQPRSLGAPRCLGIVSDRARGRHWLFLEPVQGPPLAEVGDHEAWRDAARWLARFHGAMSRLPALGGPLIAHDRRFHRWWFRRAVALAREGLRADGPGAAAARQRLEALAEIADAHRAAADSVLELDPVFIHGEFYPSNVLVEGEGGGIRPVDWEMAGFGPRLLDLAALTAGELGVEERTDLVEAYRAEARAAGTAWRSRFGFYRELTMCRLLQAVQWLGWAKDWTPPREHQNDWLLEARRCAHELAA